MLQWVVVEVEGGRDAAVLQCAGKAPAIENYPVENVNRNQAEKPDPSIPYYPG